MARRIKAGTNQREIALYDGRVILHAGDTVVVSDDEFSRLSALIESADLIDLGSTLDDPVIPEAEVVAAKVVPATSHIITVGAANTTADSWWGSGAYVEGFTWTAPKDGVVTLPTPVPDLTPDHTFPAGYVASADWETALSNVEVYLWDGAADPVAIPSDQTVLVEASSGILFDSGLVVQGQEYTVCFVHWLPGDPLHGEGFRYDVTQAWRVFEAGEDFDRLLQPGLAYNIAATRYTLDPFFNVPWNYGDEAVPVPSGIVRDSYTQVGVALNGISLGGRAVAVGGKALNDDAVAMRGVASGPSSVALGSQSKASGAGALALGGGAVAGGDNSTAIGPAEAALWGEHAQYLGFGSQHGLSLNGQTTLTTDNIGNSSVQGDRLIPLSGSGSIRLFRVFLAATRDSDGVTAVFEIRGAIKGSSAPYALVGTPIVTQVAADVGATGWGVAVAIDTDALRLRPTGTTNGQSITWKGSLHTYVA